MLLCLQVPADLISLDPTQISRVHEAGAGAGGQEEEVDKEEGKVGR